MMPRNCCEIKGGARFTKCVIIGGSSPGRGGGSGGYGGGHDGRTRRRRARSGGDGRGLDLLRAVRPGQRVAALTEGGLLCFGTGPVQSAFVSHILSPCRQQYSHI
jgi:hypothetical protein